MPYVDGFVLAVPKDKVDAYKKMATLGRDVWMEHGALSYVECIADDVPYGELTSFPRAVQATEDEVVFFSWITYTDRESRELEGAYLALLPVRYDAALWHADFLAQWPAGSAAWLSYWQRISQGPAFAVERALVASH